MPQAQSSYQFKLEQLQAAKLRIEHKLQTHATDDWGDEMMMWRQSLLDELANIEQEIIQVKNAMDSAPKHPTYLVEIEGRQKELKIVPSNLVAPSKGFISDESPLAKALKSSKAGDVVEMPTPRGTSSYKLIEKQIT